MNFTADIAVRKLSIDGRLVFREEPAVAIARADGATWSTGAYSLKICYGENLIAAAVLALSSDSLTLTASLSLNTLEIETVFASRSKQDLLPVRAILWQDNPSLLVADCRASLEWQPVNPATPDPQKLSDDSWKAVVRTIATELVNSEASARADADAELADAIEGKTNLSITISGIIKGDGAGNLSAAVAGQDFAAVNHTHAAASISGLSVVATSGSYGDLLNIPATFTPSAHTHAAASISGLSAVATSGNYADLSNKPALFSGSYGDLSGVPATFPPSAHTQAASTITDFADAVAANLTVAANTAARHTHSNKTVLDVIASSPLLASNNFSDIPDKVSARSNLGLGSASTYAKTYFLQAANSLSDVADAAAARTNIGAAASTALASEVSARSTADAARVEKTDLEKTVVGSSQLNMVLGQTYVWYPSSEAAANFAGGEYYIYVQSSTAANVEKGFFLCPPDGSDPLMVNRLADSTIAEDKTQYEAECVAGTAMGTYRLLGWTRSVTIKDSKICIKIAATVDGLSAYFGVGHLIRKSS